MKTKLRSVLGAVCLLTSATLAAQECAPGETEVAFPGGEISYITVPADIPDLHITAAGGVGGKNSSEGGGSPGLGAVVTGTLEVSERLQLAVLVATAGGAADPTESTICGGGGGGSFIGLGTGMGAFAQDNLLFAAGGGGGACSPSGFGGAGGTPEGGDGGSPASNPNPATGGGADGSGGTPNVDDGGTGGGAATGGDGPDGQGIGLAGGGGAGAGGDGGGGANGNPPAGGGHAAINGGAGGNPQCSTSTCGGTGGFGGGGGGAVNGGGGGGGYSGGGGTFGTSHGPGGGSSFAADAIADVAMAADNDGDGRVVFCIPADVHNVSAAVTEGDGTITPGAQIVLDGTNVQFSATPDTGWQLASLGGDTCMPQDQGGGTWVAENITENCHVEATFAMFDVYTVTATAGDNGSITPGEQSVAHGDAAIFTVTPDTGYTAVITGDCPPGELNGQTYVTGPVTADCEIAASFITGVLPDEIFLDRFEPLP